MNKPKRRPSTPSGKGEAVKWLRDHVQWADEAECLIWPFYRNPVSGHGYFGFEGESYMAHRFMCGLVNGPPPTPEHQTAHECGKAHLGCVNPRHLSWKTKSENERDKRKHGTQWTRGKRRWKLTPEQVAEIRRSSDRVPALAARYSVTESNIRQILLRKTWKFDGYTPIGFAVKPYRRPAQQES